MILRGWLPAVVLMHGDKQATRNSPSNTWLLSGLLDKPHNGEERG